jgi:hypothetical protein
VNAEDLQVGRCYEASMADDSTIPFRYLGIQAGIPIVEAPPASGHIVPLKTLNYGVVIAFWPID